MEREWDNLNFVVLNHKGGNIKVLQGGAVEDIQIMLDDHALKA
jgi:hypothetical protein